MLVIIVVFVAGPASVATNIFDSLLAIGFCCLY